jgi:FixJ family two-component response regulator
MTPSIFVIEDDFAVRDALVQLLRAEGLRARGFANGDEFFANLPSDPVACVVTDLRMPGMDGVDEVMVDKDVVEGRKEPIRVYAEKAKKTDGAAA